MYGQRSAGVVISPCIPHPLQITVPNSLDLSIAMSAPSEPSRVPAIYVCPSQRTGRHIRSQDSFSYRAPLSSEPKLQLRMHKHSSIHSFVRVGRGLIQLNDTAMEHQRRYAFKCIRYNLCCSSITQIVVGLDLKDCTVDTKSVS